MSVDWMIDELDYAGQEHLNPEFVKGYEQRQGNPDPTADLDVLAEHGLGPTSTVVDLGAGTGIFALAAAHRFGRIIAVDVSPAMLRVVRERATKSGLVNLECVQAGFLSYLHTGVPVDAVYTRNALHHLPDFWKALAVVRMAAMMRTGGLLRLHDLIYDFQPHEAERVFGRWLDGAAEDPAKGYTSEDLAQHIRTEHSTFRWLLEPILVSSGFEVLTAVFRGSVYGAYTCVKR
jgi:cyclopropane fatty-acyl-phospholipid synthase-like methyltransferase